MLDIHIQKKAEKDLEEIWQYTFEIWYMKQADSYIDGLDQFFSMIADNPAIGTNIGHIRKGYRKMIFKRHSIIYRTTLKSINIVRVLGVTMDNEKHL